MKAKHWYDSLWVYAIIYFALGFFNILFAWLGMIDFLLPLFLAIFGGNKFFCNHLCGRGQLFSKLGTDLKCSRCKTTPRWMSSKWFRYTEEFVRDIFVSEENLPDVLVCMDEVVTECVYQALVDYNQVGNVDVVGFYYSDVILDGISKGIISSAIALDMDEIGRYSVNALEEFSSLGHTSNYYSVGQHVITRSNVGAYRTEGN